VTALVAARWLGSRLRRPQVVALWGLAAGLLLLAASAQPESAQPLAAAGAWAVLAAVVPVALLAVVAGRWPDGAASAGLATAAGLGFGGVGIAARTVSVPAPWWQHLVAPLPAALAAYAAVALYAYAAALQRGRVTVVAAVTFAVETVVPALIGLALLGDAARPGWAPVAAVGFVLTLGAAVRLARLAEVPEASADPA
jgi:drug/metabolite transporter (DMT)-like permease